MAKRMHKKFAGLITAMAALSAISPAQAADSLFTWTDLRGLKIYHAYAASDGKSYVEEINVPAAESASVKHKGTPMQTYFDLKPVKVRIARAVQGAMYEWHYADEYRHLIIPLQGSIFFDLGEGRTLTLKPGEAIFAEDWTGKGHRSGCAPSKVEATCVGLDMLTEINPHTLPLRPPPQP